MKTFYLLFFVCIFFAFHPSQAQEVISKEVPSEKSNKAEAINDSKENNPAIDWPWLRRFQQQNQALMAAPPIEKRVVFMGNSITEGWSNIQPDFWKNEAYINRGISGQTTPQMLLRFSQDVIHLKPATVLILAGTNDIAGNTGPMTLDQIMDNIIAMAHLAKVNNIEVILCSVLPAYDYTWRPGLQPNVKIPQLNSMIKNFAEQNNFVYLDYFSAMANEKNGLKAHLGEDGVHPNLLGYQIMAPLAEKAIEKTFKRK